jgi:hypothetical protein
MAESNESEFSKEEVGKWLQQELRNVTKGMQLRLAEATDLTTAYTLGEITEGEVEQRMNHYYERWGDYPLLGVQVTGSETDDQILKAFDLQLHNLGRSHAARVKGRTPKHRQM